MSPDLKCFKANPDYSQRTYNEDDHAYRDKFARDRDRILYSKEFRRLSGKTQVFVVGYDDHARTRLTHTLEVAQIATTISNTIGLNNSLCEAIALGHDVGHTPFGHVGERTLNLFMNGCDKFKDFNTDLPADQLGFKHNWQGVRVTTDLEKTNHNYPGLNLTDYTLWGILHHSNLDWKPCDYYINGKCSIRHLNHDCTKPDQSLHVTFYQRYLKHLRDTSWTVEALIVQWADEIAQRHHDIEDGLEANIIDKDELIEYFKRNFDIYLSSAQKNIITEIHKENNKSFFMPLLNRLIIDFYVSNLIGSVRTGLENIKKEYQINNDIDFEKAKGIINKQEPNKPGLLELITFKDHFVNKDEQFKKFLSNRILNSHLAQSMDGKSNYILRQSIKAYLTNPQQLPDQTIYRLYSNLLPRVEWQNLIKKSTAETIGTLRDMLKYDHSQDTSSQYKTLLLRTICDYIAGMTDQYALQRYKLLYGLSNPVNYSNGLIK